MKRRRSRADVDLALELGWIDDGRTGGGHIKFVHPVTGAALFMSYSPSDHRAIQNSCATVRRITRQQEEKSREHS